MAAGRMMSLARLIELDKEKSHVIQTVLNAGTARSKAGDPCPVLHEAIGQLRPDQLRREDIPQAIAELREINAVTESSVDLIMGKAEDLMDHEHAMEGAISILEACGFQDLVGQRVSKVTKLLESLEERFHSLVHETGVEDSLDAMGEEELQEEHRRKELILHGPQLTGDGISQDEIDALLGA